MIPTKDPTFGKVGFNDLSKPVKVTEEGEVLKRRHRFYTQAEKANALKDVKQYGISKIARWDDIPTSTLRTWLKQDQTKTNWAWNALLWGAEFTGVLIVGVVIIILITLGVCYLYGGREEVLFMGRQLWQLVANLHPKN